MHSESPRTPSNTLDPMITMIDLCNVTKIGIHMALWRGQQKLRAWLVNPRFGYLCRKLI